MLAHDHQQLMMTTMKSVAEKYGMKCLLHEKPFSGGVNGSGKHVNFSLGNANQGNLLNPGDTPAREHAVPHLLRRHHPRGPPVRRTPACRRRIGVERPPSRRERGPPPAIISIFLGEQLMDVFEQIAKGGATGSKAAGVIELGVDTLPPLKADPGDRNRTSPFAFTGNRFEYRAPGSNQSISDPMVAINTILADSIDFISAELEKLIADGTELNDAVQKVLQEIINTHGAVIFNGNGYSDEWQEEAAARGLKNLRTTVDAVTEYTSPEVIEIFEKYGGVLSARELEAREDVIFEYYALTLLVEAKETAEIAKTMIMPAAIRYQGELAGTAASLKMAGIEAPTPLLAEVTALIGKLHDDVITLDEGIAGMHGENTFEESKYALEALIPAMAAVREVADTLESIVADDLWPLPTYNEMLTIL